MTPEQSSSAVLLGLLASDASPELKARACQQLAIVGGADAVPALASLLADERLSVSARSALEAIPGNAAGAALLTGIRTLDRPSLVAGVIDSLGVRREKSAVPVLQTLALNPGRGLAAPAVSALGRIATSEALGTIERILAAGPASVVIPAAHAALMAADRLRREGGAAVAEPLLLAISSASLPAHLRAAAEALRTAPVPSGAPGRRGARLFNGRTFKGWEGDLTWFRIVDDAIVAGRLDRAIPRNEFLCYHRELADFELRLQVRLFEGKGNGGIQFRSQRIPGDHEMIGYQADVATPHWGSLYDESRRRRFLGTRPAPALVARLVKPADWNDYIIRCEGARVRLWLNGELTTDYTETDEAVPRSGRIAVQIHSGPPSEASYRALELSELSA